MLCTVDIFFSQYSIKEGGNVERLRHFSRGNYYIMLAARAYLEISPGKTRSAPTCMHGLMKSHVAVKDHVTP